MRWWHRKYSNRNDIHIVRDELNFDKIDEDLSTDEVTKKEVFNLSWEQNRQSLRKHKDVKVVDDILSVILKLQTLIESNETTNFGR